MAGTVVVLGAGTVAGALSLGVGSASRPAPGSWPFLIGCALVVLGLAQAVTGRATDDAERFVPTSGLVAAGLVSMLGFAAVIGTIGFELPSLALMAFWLRVLGHETWRSTAVISLGTVLALYLLFVAALAVPIPHLF
nr:tripartite tricarboxylate transporter TctB family protein [Kineosporia mesophila]